MLHEAVERLQVALSDEFDRAPRICTLATVDAAGDPSARSVVCRRVLAGGELYVFSDGRSQKNAHLRANPAAEVVFWLPRRREQFRLKGPAAIEADPTARGACWSELSDAARAMYAWPPPAAARVAEDAAFPRGLGKDAPVPGTFEVLVVRPRAIEWLDLKPHPHDRRRWRAANDWVEERLNP